MRGRESGFRQVLSVREFRAVWAAELCSVLGDQLARVALAVLVFQRTSSAALTALTYALTFVPAVIGGALLSGMADRFPRRRILVLTDLVRAGLAGAMAIPSLPLPVLCLLVAALSMAAAPFKAAQLALLPQILPGDGYLVGLSLRQMTVQSAQLVGFASGGLLLVSVEPHLALGLNATTFLVSAIVIALWVRSRPAAITTAAEPAERRTSGTANRRLWPVVAMVAIVGLFVVPEGIAAPYGAALGAGSLGVGLLMAADPVGSVLGAWLLGRLRLRPGRGSVVLLAAGSGVPLVLCAPGPGLALSMILWGVSGALSTAYLIHAQAIVVDLVPDRRRGAVMGRIATTLYASQGLAIVAGGVAAEATGPFRAVAEAGLLGIVLALCVGAWWRRVARPRRDLVAGSERGPDKQESGSHISLFDIPDTSSRTNLTARLESPPHISLFRTTSTSFRTPTAATNHISLLATTTTSSVLNSQFPPNPTPHISLFRTELTSTSVDQPPAHISLLRTAHTSLSAAHLEPPHPAHISLLRTAHTSSTPDRHQLEPLGHISLLRTENTSSWSNHPEPTPTAHISLLRTADTSSTHDRPLQPETPGHISLLDTTRTSSANGRAGPETAGHISLLRTTDTSSTPDRPPMPGTDGHISLLDMTGTSSASNRTEQTIDGHISLLRTESTSFGMDDRTEQMIGGHISLLRTTGTSSAVDGGHEPCSPGHISLVDTKAASSHPSSGGDGAAGHFVDEAFRSGNRRLGTRAPSLWWGVLAMAVGRPIVGRAAAT